MGFRIDIFFNYHQNVNKVKSISTTKELVSLLGKTDMYLLDLIQKGYFDKPLRILDAGCGAGRNMFLLAELGHELVGIDQDKQCINQLQNSLKTDSNYPNNITLRVGELDQLPFKDDEFDMVVCNAVLHFSKDTVQFEKMLTEMKRVTCANGVLFLRLVTSHTMSQNHSPFNRVIELQDGSKRFVAEQVWLKNLIESKLNLAYKEEFKTVNINEKRTMTTLVLSAK